MDVHTISTGFSHSDKWDWGAARSGYNLFVSLAISHDVHKLNIPDAL